MNGVVVITGGSSGIGKATAEIFALKGYEVYELSRRPIEHKHSSIKHINCDITDSDQIATAVSLIIHQSSRIDLLISNAGYGISGSVEFTDTSDCKHQFDVNFFGAVNIVQAVLPYMRDQKSGTIIFVSSVAAVLSIPYQSFYSASKAAINSLTLALRNEVSKFGIKVCALMPGDVKTNFTADRKKNANGSRVYTHETTAVSNMEKDEQNGMTPEFIAAQIFNIAKKSHPAPLYTAGWQYKFFVLLERILPKRLSNWIVGLIYK